MKPHNPDNLTPEQIGTLEGWRLLDEDEIEISLRTQPIQAWGGETWDTGKHAGLCTELTYRTRLSPAELRKARGFHWVRKEEMEKERAHKIEYLDELMGIKDDHEQELSALRAKLAEVEKERATLEAFKTYVHNRLDEAGIPINPESPHKAEGCRIGGRLDIALSAKARIAELELHIERTGFFFAGTEYQHVADHALAILAKKGAE